MKHVVELKYTNPEHEHVSLRRRVETINRVVEAQSPDEALNRAANQQRALGFRIQSASIIEQKVEEPKTEMISEEVVTEASKEGKDVMRGMRASLKSMDLRHGVDSDKREAGYKMSPAVRAAQAKSDALSKVVKRPQAGTLAAKKIKEAAEKMVKKAREIKDDKKSLKAAEVKQDHEKKKVNKINMQPSVEVKG